MFESDRSGAQQIYVMNADGSNQQRISFGGGRYATPVWSPRGDLIAFTQIGGGFRIGVMSPGGGGEQLLTNGWQDEGPTWSPNGRVLDVLPLAPRRGRARRSVVGRPDRRQRAQDSDAARWIRSGLGTVTPLNRFDLTVATGDALARWSGAVTTE